MAEKEKSAQAKKQFEKNDSIPVRKEMSDPILEFNAFLANAGIKGEASKNLIERVKEEMNPRTQKIFIETLGQMKTAGMKINTANIDSWINIVAQSSKVYIQGGSWFDHLEYRIETERNNDYNLMNAVCQKLSAYAKEMEDEFDKRQKEIKTRPEHGIRRVFQKMYGQEKSFPIKMRMIVADSENYVDFQFIETLKPHKL